MCFWTRVRPCVNSQVMVVFVQLRAEGSLMSLDDISEITK